MVKPKAKEIISGTLAYDTHQHLSKAKFPKKIWSLTGMVSKDSKKEEVKTEVGPGACFVYDKQDDLLLDNVPDVLLAADCRNMAWLLAADVPVQPAPDVPHAGSRGEQAQWHGQGNLGVSQCVLIHPTASAECCLLWCVPLCSCSPSLYDAHATAVLLGDAAGSQAPRCTGPRLC